MTQEKEVKIAAKCGVHVEYQLRVLNPDGSVAHETKPKRNLILDVGMDNISRSDINAIFAGTGALTVRRDTGGTNLLTCSGTTVTSTSAFFQAGDVGRLLKFGAPGTSNGREVKITGFTSSTQVTVATSGTETNEQGTVWYVELTALVSRTAQADILGGSTTRTYNSGTGETTWSRTGTSAAFTSNVSLTEVAWGSGPTSLFGLDALPSPVPVLIGQQLRATVNIIWLPSPIETGGQTSVSNPITGVASDAELFVNASQAFVGGAGSGALFTLITGSYSVRSDNNVMVLSAITANWAVKGVRPTATAFGTFSNPSVSPYVDGSYQRSVTLSATISQVNGTHAGYALQPSNANNNANTTWNDGYSVFVRLLTPFTKANTHTLSLTFTGSWARRMTN